MYNVYKRQRNGFETYTYVKIGRSLKNLKLAKNKVRGFPYGGIVTPLGSNNPVYAWQ